MRFQIFLVLILFGIISNIVSTSAIISTHYNKAMEARISSLTSYGQILANSLVSTGFLNDPNGPEAEKINMQIGMISDIYEGRVVVVDQNLKIIRDTYNLEEGKVIIAEKVIRGLRGSSSTLTNEATQSVELVVPVPQSNNSKEIVAVMIMSFSVRDIFGLQETMQQQGKIFVMMFTVIMFVVAIIISARLTKPFRQITQSIEHVTDGYMDEGVSIRGFTELQSISDAFNKMLRRLKHLEDSRQQFVSNVSHELKTPITSIKVLSDSLLMQEDAPAEMYREFLVDISQEIDRENKIINDLLSLVKSDKAASEMNITEVNINELLEQNLKRLRPIAEVRGIELIYESFREVTAEIDEVKLSLAISNLIENAIKYNHDDGWVRVALNADHQYFYVRVEDSGVGIPEDEQDHIFERFYRVDKARSRDTGGTGLGLSITKNVILMHRGNLKVYSKPGEGSTFTMRIPLNYIVKR